MRTIEYLTDPLLRDHYWPGVVTAVLIAAMAAPLSVLVVLKRLAFIGQGISHAAFGGVGLALVVGLGVGIGLDLVVLGFAIASALTISWMTKHGRTNADTAIGIVLAVCMAAGFLLHAEAGAAAGRAGRPAPPTLESVLFGSFTLVGWSDTAVAAVGTALVLGLLVLLRRPMLFWAFDETVCTIHGVRAAVMRQSLLVLLAVAVVVTMKLAGIVLATALLVLPGAIALRMASSMRRVMALSTCIGLAGVVAGIVLSFETGLQTGPCVVGVLAGMFAAVSAVKSLA